MSVTDPEHYAGHSIEPIDVIESWSLGFHLGNAVKYISRCGRKGSHEDAINDLRKARWYIERAIRLRGGEL